MTTSVMTLTTVWCMSHLRCLGMAPMALALILVLGTVGARKRTKERSERE